MNMSSSSNFTHFYLLSGPLHALICDGDHFGVLRSTEFERLDPIPSITPTYSPSLFQLGTPMSDNIPARVFLLPTDIQVRPAHAEPGTCPTPSAILLNFAVVNLVVAGAGVILGHAGVMKRISGGLLGQRNSGLWVVIWIPVTGLQILANALVAVAIKWVAGYSTGFTVLQLAVFYTVRPRIGWILSLLFSAASCCCPSHPPKTVATLRPYAPTTYHSHEQAPLELRQYPRPGYHPYHHGPNWGYWHHSAVPAAVQHADATGPSKVCPWRCAALSQFFSEMALQLLALYHMGRTTVFARCRGYYIISNLYAVAPSQISQSAHLMYSAALYWLCSQVAIAFLGLVVAPVLAIVLRCCGGDITKAIHRAVIFMAVFMIPLSWLACWLFWVGYVRLAGDL